MNDPRHRAPPHRPWATSRAALVRYALLWALAGAAVALVALLLLDLTA